MRRVCDHRAASDDSSSRYANSPTDGYCAVGPFHTFADRYTSHGSPSYGCPYAAAAGNRHPYPLWQADGCADPGSIRRTAHAGAGMAVILAPG